MLAVESALVGEELLEGRFVEDYLQLLFSNERVLTIYNDFKIAPPGDIEGIKNSVVKSVFQGSDTLTIVFDNDSRFVVSLRDEAYSSPEALTLFIPGNPLVVTN